MDNSSNNHRAMMEKTTDQTTTTFMEQPSRRAEPAKRPPKTKVTSASHNRSSQASSLLGSRSKNKTTLYRNMLVPAQVEECERPFICSTPTPTPTPTTPTATARATDSQSRARTNGGGASSKSINSCRAVYSRIDSADQRIVTCSANSANSTGSINRCGNSGSGSGSDDDSNSTSGRNTCCWSSGRRWPKGANSTNYNTINSSSASSHERCKSLSMAIIIMVSLFLLLLPISSMFPWAPPSLSASSPSAPSLSAASASAASAPSLAAALEPASLIQATQPANHNKSQLSQVELQSLLAHHHQPLIVTSTKNHLSKRTTSFGAADKAVGRQNDNTNGNNNDYETRSDSEAWDQQQQKPEPESVEEYIKYLNEVEADIRSVTPKPNNKNNNKVLSMSMHNSTSTQYQLSQTEPSGKTVSSSASDQSSSLIVEDSNTILSSVKQHANNLNFYWKKISTKQCSKPCGGHLEIIWQCYDQKYNVMVEKNLCIQSGMKQPEKESNQQCGGVCEWVKSEWHGDCKKSCNLTRHVYCTYRDSQGNEIQTNDTMCDQSLKPEDSVACENCSLFTLIGSTNTQTMSQESLDDISLNFTSTVPIANVSTLSQAKDHQHTTDVDSTIEDNIVNMMPHISSSSFEMQHGHHRSMPEILSVDDRNFNQELEMYDQPIYVIGNWSDCEAPCGGYTGIRTRKVSCKMLMRVSNTFLDLPLVECLATQKEPETTGRCTSTPCSTDVNQFSSTLISQSKLDEDHTLVNNNSVVRSDDSRFFWKDHGWTDCSVECLDGTQETLIVCWDPVTKEIVDSKLCFMKPKPPITTKVCYAGECNATWSAGPWSECTKLCGFGGRRERNIVCERRIQSSDDKLFYDVKDEECIKTGVAIPPNEESCNLIDCKPQWSLSEWGPCKIDSSETCGPGISSRHLTCEQEFASKNGPNSLDDKLSYELRYAISIYNNHSTWFPGKKSKVPFEICFNELRSVPDIDRNCHITCNETDYLKNAYIDSNLNQNYEQPYPPRPSVGLRIGGIATVYEGTTVKIGCKLIIPYDHNDPSLRNTINSQHSMLIDNVASNETFLTSNRDDFQNSVWKKDGVIIFVNGSEYVNMVETQGATTNINSNAKVVGVLLPKPNKSLRFIATIPKLARFRIHRDKNSMRIRNLQRSDEGTYTCSYGSLSASLNIKVKQRPERDYYTIVDSNETREARNPNELPKKRTKRKRKTRHQLATAKSEH